MELKPLSAATYLTTKEVSKIKAKPYKKPLDPGYVYGLIDFRYGDLHLAPCSIFLPEELRMTARESIGLFNVKLIEQKNHTWLLACHAENILASLYARIRQKDIHLILNQIDLKIKE